ncbi:MAG: leucyl/phenylalanyl-tRNA--protein transferase [Rhodobacteraceae bacterium]|nr:leucyl/phenylalanyl-tRNA--protein transferase [Paracoccaceae bacterium]
MNFPLHPFEGQLDAVSRLALSLYRVGVFPMGSDRSQNEISWHFPRRRGVLPLHSFRVSRRLLRTLRSDRFSATANADFKGVIEGCAERPETWINGAIKGIYSNLHAESFAHSIEVWRNDSLVGGVYGIAIGRAFFGESMFFRRADASKVALAYLIDQLRRTGFVLLDTQYSSPHLRSLGGIEIDRGDYLGLLKPAVGTSRSGKRFLDQRLESSGFFVAQRISQMSKRL